MMLNPLATGQQLSVTPTMADGLPLDIELELRAVGCQMIQQVGVLLQLPQRTMAAAQVFYQRFWYSSSMCDFSADEIAMGTLLLSTKLEETQISLRHLVNAYHYVDFQLHKGPRSCFYTPPAYDASELVSIRDAIVVSEMQVLKRLGFQVHVALPYALLVNYLQVLGLTDPELKVTVRPHKHWHPDEASPPIDRLSSERVSVAQCAWSFLNDALQTPVLCIFGPHIVACAAIVLATEMCEPVMQLPLEPAPWWLLFDASEPEIKLAATHLLWRYHHVSSVKNLVNLLDRHELQKYVAARLASA
ncbi:uncharacterized protein SPSC_04228 [Sporisorium scitamineum]|uniref:Cyclin-like domain-containing protein n=1 Tax=Sporisorium scitamineum TaxID=49012 RepID=A0A0F7S3W0_9BASI|nr:uncharacterized protein SPSC_04228 [Sporisorium scitamineum]CDS01687.1 hypothetical protein [Sporisorium scitamineum]